MKIGLSKLEYPEKRCIYNIIDECEYLNLSKINLYRYMEIIIRKIIPNARNNYSYRFKSLKKKDISGYHFFNYITNDSIPWISTFETFLPRCGNIMDIHRKEKFIISDLEYKIVEKYIKIIAKDECKKIIALSKCNYNIQKELISLYPSYEEKILNKLVQIYPPQEPIIKDYSEKKLNNNIKFTFVGRDFIRKGGYESILALKSVRDRLKCNIELTIITDINKSYNYVFNEFQDDYNYLKKVHGILEESNWINYYKDLDNKKVIEIMKNTDVGLLPTWGDTFGYSVLEFQACGCPVISTSVRALKEINNDNIGWIIELPTNRFNEVIIKTSQDKERLRDIIIYEMEKKIEEIIRNRDIIRKKGQLSLENIKKVNNTKEYSKKINNIYRENF